MDLLLLDLLMGCFGPIVAVLSFWAYVNGDTRMSGSWAVLSVVPTSIMLLLSPWVMAPVWVAALPVICMALQAYLIAFPRRDCIRAWVRRIKRKTYRRLSDDAEVERQMVWTYLKERAHEHPDPAVQDTLSQAAVAILSGQHAKGHLREPDAALSEREDLTAAPQPYGTTAARFYALSQAQALRRMGLHDEAQAMEAQALGAKMVGMEVDMSKTEVEIMELKQESERWR